MVAAFNDLFFFNRGCLVFIERSSIILFTRKERTEVGDFPACCAGTLLSWASSDSRLLGTSPVLTKTEDLPGVPFISPSVWGGRDTETGVTLEQGAWSREPQSTSNEQGPSIHPETL